MAETSVGKPGQFLRLFGVWNQQIGLASVIAETVVAGISCEVGGENEVGVVHRDFFSDHNFVLPFSFKKYKS